MLGVLYAGKNNPAVRSFVLFLGWSVCFEVLMYMLSANGIANHWLYNLFTYTELFFYGWIFYKYGHLGEIRPYLLIIISALIANEISRTVRSEWKQMNEILTIFTHFVLILCSGFTLIRMFDNLDVFPFRQPIFWIAFGVLFYFTLSLTVLSAGKLLISNKEYTTATELFDVIYASANIAGNLIFSVAFICNKVFRKFSL